MSYTKRGERLASPASSRDWKKYEWGVIITLYNKSGSFNVRYNVKLKGKSGLTRQADLIVLEDEHADLYGLVPDPSYGNFEIVDCKNRHRPVGVKDVEQFIGLADDVGAKHGTIVSSSGFTSGARMRSQTRKNIQLTEVSWEAAYNSVCAYIPPSYISSRCTACASNAPHCDLQGYILWHGIVNPVVDEVVHAFWVGKCLKCEKKQLWCDSCGATSSVSGRRVACPQCSTDVLDFWASNLGLVVPEAAEVAEAADGKGGALRLLPQKREVQAERVGWHGAKEEPLPAGRATQPSCGAQEWPLGPAGTRPAARSGQ